MLKSLKRVSGETTQAMQYVFKLRRTFTILMVLSFSYSFGQIQGTIFGLSEINSQFHFVQVNPNTGFVNSIAIQTTPQGLNGTRGSAAINCNSDEYCYGAETGNGLQPFVIDNTSGNLITTFGYQITCIVYNELTGLYYGLELIPQSNGLANFVSFEPTLGLRNVISTLPIPITDPNHFTGATLDLSNNKYMYIDEVGGYSSIVTIDINSGTVISSQAITLNNTYYSEGFWGLAFANDNNTCYGMTINTVSGYQIYCSIDPSSGAITKLDSTNDYSLAGPMGDGLSSTTISESDHILTYISFANKVVSYNYITGTVVSSPLLSTNRRVYFTQFANCSVTGMEEADETSRRISVAPNLTDALIQVNVPLGMINTNYCIIDTMGKTVLAGTFEDETITIDLCSLDNGIYFLKCMTAETTTKVIVNH